MTLHPLEPLTAAEVTRAVAIVREVKQLAPTYRFVMVSLKEPAREVVARFRPGEVAGREAFLILLDNATGRGYEAVVDLTRGTVPSFEALPLHVQPPIMLDEFVECEEDVKRSPEFLAALKKRGVSDVNLVMVDPWSAGCYGNETEDDRSRRLSRALCWVRSEPNARTRTHQTVAVVDLTDEVLRRDYGVVPLPPSAGNWARVHPRSAARQAARNHAGRPASAEGHEIAWQKWRLHRLQRVKGSRSPDHLCRSPVLQRIRRRDGGAVRRPRGVVENLPGRTASACSPIR